MNNGPTAQVLRTAELALIIADFCAWDKHTLFSLSLTWRAFREPATEVLWREVEATELLRAIPDETRAIIDIRDGKLHRIIRRIQWPELRRFVRLARCIRAMNNCIESDPPGYTVLNAILCHWTPMPNWFPKLRDITFEGEGRRHDHPIVHTLLQLSAHQLEAFRYYQSCLCFLPAASDMLPYLEHSAGTLRILKAGQMVEGDNDIAALAWDRWSDFIVSLHNPEEIEVEFPLNLDALKYLSASPNLTRLGFHISSDCRLGPNGHDGIVELQGLTSFSSLKALTLRVDNIYSYPALDFFEAVRSPLEVLHLEWTYYPRYADLLQVVDAIPDRLPALKDLTFSVHDITHDERNDEDEEEDNTPFDASVLEGLFRLRHLRRLSIGMELGITPQFIRSVAAAWPHLRSLNLHRGMYTEYDFRTSVMVMDLCPLAECCRSLQLLVVMLRGSSRTGQDEGAGDEGAADTDDDQEGERDGSEDSEDSEDGEGGDDSENSEDVEDDDSEDGEDGEDCDEEMERGREGLPVSGLGELYVLQSERRLTRNDKNVLAIMFPLAYKKYFK